MTDKTNHGLKFRPNQSWFYQGILISVIFFLFFILLKATEANLALLGVEPSIDFLWKRAGFEISQKFIHYTADSTIFTALVVALINTLVLAFVSIFCASLLGLIIGISKLSQNWLVRTLATTYIELFRNIPSLIQIFFWYFVVLSSLPLTSNSFSFLDVIYLNNRGLFFPKIELDNDFLFLFFLASISTIVFEVLSRRWKLGEFRKLVYLPFVLLILSIPFFEFNIEIPIASKFGYVYGYVLMPEFMALVVGLSMYNATYIGEIVRSGFLSVSKGQTEAAESLGFTRFMIIRLILLPQALRVMIPPLTTVYLNLFKGTSLAAAIAYPEVISVFVGTVNNMVGQPVYIMLITMVIYMFVSLCIAFFLNYYNKKMSLMER